MDEVNIINQNQMAQYDFSKPINVTIIFEDGDEESLGKNAFKEQIQNYHNKLEEDWRNENKHKQNIKYEATKKNIPIKKTKEENMINEHSDEDNIANRKKNKQTTDNSCYIVESDNLSRNIESTNTVDKTANPKKNKQTTDNSCFIVDSYNPNRDIESTNKVDNTANPKKNKHTTDNSCFIVESHSPCRDIEYTNEVDKTANPKENKQSTNNSCFIVNSYNPNRDIESTNKVDYTANPKENKHTTDNTCHILERKNPSKDIECINIQNSLIELNSNSDTDTDSNNVSNENDQEGLNENVYDLLKVVLENIILIMRYHCCHNLKNREVSLDSRAMYLQKLKVHFFDLSYSSVVTLILPRENNKNFIDRFIDKIVAEANEVFALKCGRKDVEPFYNEMIKWVKKKRNNINSLRLQSSYDERTNGCQANVTKIFKERLTDPPKSFYTPPPAFKNVAVPIGANLVNPNDNILNNENSMCILSTGPPGREVTITVDRNTLLNHTNYNNSNQRNINYSTYPPNIQQASRQAQYNYNYVNQQSRYPQTYTLHYQPSPRLPPPPYQNHNTSHNISYNTKHIQENIAQNGLNYQTQRSFNYFTAPAPNILNFGQMELDAGTQFNTRNT